MEEERYPLILDGRQAGEVTVTRAGGWTVFRARCTGASGIVRISVYGGGREGYLGVLAPEEDAMTLCRRMSRSALRDFPSPIEYAGRAGQPCTDEAAPEEAAPEAPEETTAPAPAEPPAEQAREAEAESPPELADAYWYASPDGALVCFDGRENLIALPAGDERIPAGGGGWPRSIEGRDYIIFRTENGRLIR